MDPTKLTFIIHDGGRAERGSPPWSPSHQEEVISALWFIVAFVALDAGCPRWVFLGFFIKACFDLLCAIKCAMQEWWSEDSGANVQGMARRDGGQPETDG